MYEVMNSGKDQEVAPVSDESYIYTSNVCYRLQTCQQKNTATGADDGGYRSVGGGAEVEHGMTEGDSQKGMKRCLIALVFAVVLMAVVTIAALALAVINYSHLSGELTNKVNLLSIQQQQSLSSTRDNISQVVANLSTIKNYLLYYDQGIPNCGAGLWYRVAFLNMIDPSQQCPSAWRLVTTNGVRACGRLASSGSSCLGTFYSATSEYQRVCGRVIGYQDKSPDGFLNADRSINDIYMDGVSITYGQPRNHIWSYAGGVTEGSTMYGKINNCPCSTAAGTGPQSFVGDNYYCESGNPTDDRYSFYSADKLWDGEQCEGTCCTDTKSPPWFSVRLPNPTTESIEVRICGSEGTSNEDTPIELLEIFVQ